MTRRLLTGVFWLLALVLGALEAWVARFQPSTIDAVSYLDIGDAYVHGRWSEAINAYWNPLYSWILGVVMAVARPSPALQYPLAKAVDFGVYVLCLCAFAWFLENVIASHARTNAAGARIPDWVWIVGGYSLFIWASLRWIRLTSNTPDMLAAALAYVACSLLLRLEQRERPVEYVVLGAVLGLAYFSRSPMFFVAAVIVGCLWLRGSERGFRRGALVAATVFLIVTLPYIVSISRAREHLTIGDNGLLNHAWLTNPGGYEIPNRHWQGGPAGYGRPLHPSRVIWTAPPAFEFNGPIGGTFPPWTDPSYWYQGLAYHFDRKAEWESIQDNLRFYDRMFGRWLLVAAGLAMLLVGHLRRSIAAFVGHAVFWAPAVVGLLAYLLANNMLAQPLPIQPPTRYVAAYVVMLCAALAMSIRMRAHVPPIVKGAMAAGVIAVSVGLMTASTTAVAQELRENREMPPSALARALHEEGITRGMRVATIGSPDHHEFWARLAGVQIVDEVPHAAAFWSKPLETRQQILQALARTGAEYVVSPPAGPRAVREGWRLVKDGNYVVYDLAPLNPALSAAHHPARSLPPTP